MLPLRIALLTRQPESASNRRLTRAAEERGHTVIQVDRTRVSLFIDTARPSVIVEGRPLEGIDAVIVRSARTISSFSAAIVRQFEMLGARALNSAEALARAGDALAVRQVLTRSGVLVPEAAVSHADTKGQNRSEGHILVDSLPPAGLGPLVRFAIVGGRAIAAIERDIAPRKALDEPPQWRRHESSAVGPAGRLAEKAARTLDLALADIDIVQTHQGPMVTHVASHISIALFERTTNAAIAKAVVTEIEQQVRSSAARPPRGTA